ncbi:carbohydrate ABC transporter permease [Streptomyces aidingensis]|uniref:N,N'-diacetylchitobiose transport system permease protein n=1 Tax=Streptomyces aidingensis TaxID=910347 RepID=A0A1I1RU61_9ACTN|nr:carbohydrate ABC transporter permease [Streptomyces aidingensis]SFD35063.1 N,N'-diacetylchitobiose transport system permease protein [Streptomyces aidingensis]
MSPDSTAPVEKTTDRMAGLNVSGPLGAPPAADPVRQTVADGTGRGAAPRRTGTGTAAPVRRGPHRPRGTAPGRIWPNAAALLLIAVFLFPVYWMVSSSLKPQTDILTKDPSFLFVPTFENYSTATGAELFWTYAANSVIVTLGAVLLALLVALMAGFALARMRFRGRRAMVLVVMVAQMAPWEVLIIVMYLNARDLDMLNSVWSLTLIYFVMALPFTIWTLRGFIAAVPRELEEAAMIDGCGRTGAFFRVIFPLLAPGLMATSIFGFIMAWNEFAMVLVLNKSPEAKTLPIWLSSFQTAFGNDWGATMAASTLVTLPVVILFLIIQRRVTGGMAAGAVKG